ncbi:unnamed protein product [Durusdinium trenchii]|uniref:Uncharacterized protein n=1 Tax=Durusdinium trenchii TaxID=1381693 RepID=A0ABP0JXQ2_9DINO
MALSPWPFLSSPEIRSSQLRGSKVKPALGMLLLDGKERPSGRHGSFDHPGSFDYEVKQEVVKGLTAEVCQLGSLTEELEKNLAESIAALEAAGASVICGDTGAMMVFQHVARKKTKLPVILSALHLLPTVTGSHSHDAQVAVFTEHRGALEVMKKLVHEEYGIDLEDSRYIIVDCTEIPGFATHDDAEMEAGLVARAQRVLQEHPEVRAFLLESTRLPRHLAHAVRKATARPVFDAHLLCDFYIDSHMDNPRFGKKSHEPKAKPWVSRLASWAKKVGMKAYTSWEHAIKPPKAVAAVGVKLGVIRLDYHYPPARGDVDHPGSYGYEVHYHMVEGLTFEMCQSGKLTPEVEAAFLHGLRTLESKGVSVITGDCGFMMWLQELARKNTKLPVIMSSLVTLPVLTSSYHHGEKIAIFTANGQSLLSSLTGGAGGTGEPFIFVGCEEVPGFEAVALGQKVDVKKVTPGIVEKAKQVLRAHPQVRAILMECTELPPYSDAVRYFCGVPVFDAITACDFYIACHGEKMKL